METSDRICRMCLTTSQNLSSLFDSSANSELLTIIRNTVGLKITEDDAFSKMVCKQCALKLQTIDAHIKMFQESDRKLRSSINDHSNGQGKDLTAHEVDKTLCPVNGNDEIKLIKDAKPNENEFIKPEQPPPFRYSRRSARIGTQCEQSENYHEKEPNDEVSREGSDCDNESTTSVETDHFVPYSKTANSGNVTIRLETKPKRQKKNLQHKQTKRTVPSKTCRDVPTLHDFKCYICGSEPLGSRKALIEHLATHVDKVPYTCKQCVMETIILTRVRTLNTHMKMHEQPIKCDYCDRRYSNAAGKYYHTHTYHLGGGAPCTVNCKTCGKQYGSQAALKQHMKYHTTTLKCSQCDMVFNHPNKRRNHELTHNENRGYECVVCKKVLQTIESYDVHLKKHSQERSYQCTLCPKKFNTSFNLILHLKVHAKNYNYRPAKSWVEHYTILSRDPMQYKCNHCERYNTDKVNNMISHLQAHFKEYECDQCKRLFATAKQLRAHYTTHTGEKSEMCQHCGKCFSTKNNLRIHLKCHERESGTTIKNDQLFVSAVPDCPPEPCIEIEAVSNSTSTT